MTLDLVPRPRPDLVPDLGGDASSEHSSTSSPPYGDEDEVERLGWDELTSSQGRPEGAL